jgi:hypothetical protein
VDRRFVPALLLISGGVLVWAAAFLASYAFAAVACARGFADATLLGVAVVPAASGAATLAAAAGIVAVARRALRRSDPPSAAIRDAALVVCVLGAIGVIWNALPPLLVAARC